MQRKGRTLMNDSHSVGKTIKKYRELHNITQKELTKACGYSSKSSISNMENDKTDIPQRNILTLCEQLDITPNELFGYRSCLDNDHHLDFLYSSLSTINKNKLVEYAEFLLSKQVKGT